MNTERHQTQETKQQPSQNMNESEEQLHISQPQVERAEGPFEHSGEASGWTEEEKEEKEQQDSTEGQ